MLVIPESVLYITVLSCLLQNIFDCVSCRWWGIHHGPPLMSLFLLTSTSHLGIRLRNQENYLGPTFLNGHLPCFQHDFTSLALDWNISLSVQLQVLYSHSMVCIEIPWESLTSMVISLTLVNILHHWIVIKWFLPCLTSRHCNQMVRFILFRVHLEDLEFAHIFPRLWWSLFESYYTNPLCLGCGHVIISSWIYACV